MAISNKKYEKKQKEYKKREQEILKKYEETTMTKNEIEKYIQETMTFFRTCDVQKNSTEKDFKWQEDYIRKHLYKKYNIKE